MYKYLPGGRILRRTLQLRSVGATNSQGSLLLLHKNAMFVAGGNSVATRSFGKKETIGVGITVARKKGKETGYCYGCGADLVKEGEAGTMKTAEKRTGFWADQKDTLKKAQLKNWALCPRCSRLNKMAKNEDGIISKEASELLGPDSKMSQVFRTQVSKIRALEKAVVVLCVDAINISGTLIRTIRNYVGGNPILLAVTRCDLLPDYVFQDKTVNELKAIFAERCKDIMPADVYLCSEDRETMHEIEGIKQLAADLWQNLNGRDPYIIGAANIGKSTLTDILIAGFVHRGERLGHFQDRLAVKRVEKLKEARITRSALPGTTLQNIRVPCFTDHKQALWDTPGLLLDESLAHFPIRNFRLIRAQRPEQIQPHVMEVPKKAFCLLISERGDDLPLLRVEVRMKKDAEGDGPVHMVWNSTLDLDTKIVDIKEAHEAEQERVKQLLLNKPAVVEQEQQQQQPQQQQGEDRRPLTDEERKRRKEEKRQAYLERAKKEQEEIGKAEWKRRQAEQMAKAFDEQRSKILAKLTEVNQVIIDADVGTDIAIANFGWIGFLSSRPAMVKTFAPSSGVRVVSHPALALPPSVGPYKVPKTKDGATDRGDGSDDEHDDFDEEYDEEYEEGGRMYDEYPEYDDYSNAFGFDGMLAGDMEDSPDDDYRKRRWYRREEFISKDDDKNDPWAQYSGKYVGWQFDADTRFSKSGRLEGWNPIYVNPDAIKKDEEDEDEF